MPPFGDWTAEVWLPAKAAVGTVQPSQGATLSDEQAELGSRGVQKKTRAKAKCA